MLSKSSGTVAASTDAIVDEPRPVAAPVRVTYRRLRISGLDAVEAGNLTAHVSGLHVVRTGWRPEEIEGLLFIRELARTGRIGS